MTKQSEHLSSAQIENYGNRTSGARPDAAQGDEHQRVADKPSDDQSTADQSIIDQRSNDQLSSDRRMNDQLTNDQRVEAHLADCASCRNRLLDFHRSLFASPVDPPEPDRLKADNPKNDPPENVPSLSGRTPSGHSPTGERPADSSLEGARPTDSALADSKFANPNDLVDHQVRTAPTPECPSDDALRQLAAGITPDDAAAKLTQHAATCDHCGPLLRTFTEDFSDDFTPEEQVALATLPSSSAEWHKNTAKKILEAGRVHPAPAPVTDEQSSLQKSFAKPTAGRKPFFWKWILIPATAVIALAAITFPVYLARRDTPEKVEKYLAEAYPQQRTIEMRWPGTQWGEPSDTLGSVPANKPLSLLKADEAIQRQTPETLRKKEWLHLRAQSEILGGAELLQLTQDLTEAMQSQPDSTLMFDLAIAYFRMGEVTHDRKYYEKSKSVLDEILASSRSSTALFDRAVVEQRLNLKDAAIIDLSDCLEKETDGKWKAEIQQKIQRLKASSGR